MKQKKIDDFRFSMKKKRSNAAPLPPEAPTRGMLCKPRPRCGTCWRMARPRAGAPCRRSARRRHSCQRLLRVAQPLPELPGAARRAAAGPGGPRDGAARGGSGSTPGERRPVHAGARLAAAVPRRMRDGHRLRGWDGKGHACQSANRKSPKVVTSQINSISLNFYNYHVSFFTSFCSHTLIVNMLLYSFWTLMLTLYFCCKLMFDVSAV